MIESKEGRTKRRVKVSASVEVEAINNEIPEVAAARYNDQLRRLLNRQDYLKLHYSITAAANFTGLKVPQYTDSDIEAEPFLLTLWNEFGVTAEVNNSLIGGN